MPKKIIIRSVGKTFYFYLLLFLTRGKKFKLELKCPSINQLEREKTKY